MKLRERESFVDRAEEIVEHAEDNEIARLARLEASFPVGKQRERISHAIMEELCRIGIVPDKEDSDNIKNFK